MDAKLTGSQDQGRSGSMAWEYFVVLLLAGLLYGLTAAPGPLWQDNGLAQVRVLEHDFTGKLGLALAHPLFYLCASAFQILPFVESAFKTNLTAAFFAAVTVANFYLLMSLVLTDKPYRRSSAVVASISLMLAHTFWQHAAMAEVYSVSTAILTLELVLLVKFFRTDRKMFWFLAWFFNGLECSNHMLATVSLAAIVIWSLLLVRSGRIKLRWFAPAACLWIVGALPYEILGFMAWRDGQSLMQVIKSMLFGEYQSEVLNVGFSVGMLVTTFGVIALNFLTPNLIFVPVGIIRSVKILPKQLAILFGLLTAFHLMFAIRYPVRDQYTFFIMSILFLAFWLGIGVAWFFICYPKKRLLIICMSMLPPIGYAFVPTIVRWRNPEFAYPPIPYRQEASYFFWPWKFGYDGPDKLVNEAFDLAEPGAIIMADSTSVRPFQYARLAHNRRPDVRVVEVLYPGLSTQERIEKCSQELKEHRIFIIRPYPRYAPSWLLENFDIRPVGEIFEVQARQ